MEETDTRKEIGKRIRLAREHRGMDRLQLAEAVGVHHGTVARWETGGAAPTPFFMEKLASVLQVEPGMLKGDVPLDLSKPYPRKESQSTGTPLRVRESPSLDGNGEFWRRYDAIESSDIPEALKVYKVDALAAAIRALAQDKDAAAAEGRSRVMELEVGLTLQRTTQISEQAEPRRAIPHGPPRPRPRPSGEEKKPA